MRRFILCLAALLALAVLPTGCDRTAVGAGGEENAARVEDEENAVKVYTYPADNILGLEKIAVFEDHVIAVFAADGSASDGSAEDGAAADDRKISSYLRAEDVSYALPTTATLETADGCRILRVDIDRSDPNIKIPEHPVISGLHCDGADIDFSDGSTTVGYTVRGGECSQTRSQTYDAGSGKWQKVEEDFKTYYFGPAQ